MANASRPVSRDRLKALAAIAVSLLVGLAIGAVFVGGPSGKTGAGNREFAGGGPGQGGGMGGPGGPGGRPGGAGQRPLAVTLTQPVKAPISDRLTAIGTGRAVQSLTLTADVSGVIEEILIEPGKAVAAGARLVVLEKREQEIALARARADFGIAKTNAARFAGLRASEAASALEQESAQNELTAATAALRQAEYDLERRAIRAPFDGVVGLTEMDVGDFLTMGAVLTTIDDVSSLLVDFVIPENASPYVRAGMEVAAAARASDRRAVTGAIRAIDSRVDSASRTRRVEAVLKNEDRTLVPGSTFEISLAVEGRSGFLIPGLAIQWDRAGSYVWRMNKDGAAERVPVVIAKRTENAVLVDSALSQTDQIVSEGADLVRPGAPLRPPSSRDGAGGGVSSQ